MQVKKCLLKIWGVLAMDEKKAELIGDKIVSIFPLVKRRLLKSSEDHFHSYISNLEYRVLSMLSCSGSMPMTEVGERLCASKPHTSSLINRLVADGLVERRWDKKDRRIINVAITKKGINSLSATRKIIKDDIKKNISELSDKDIKSLNDSLDNIKNILLKLEEGGKQCINK
jgi:DNA-binding MarR family transcriptional regulator